MKFRCDYNYIKLKRIGLAVPIAIVGLFFAVCCLLFGMISIIIIAVALPIFIFVFAKYMPIQVIAREYHLQKRSLMVVSGVILKTEQQVPLLNIQYITLKRNILERMLKISTIEVMLGAGNIKLKGLGVHQAEKLKEKLEELQ